MATAGFQCPACGADFDVSESLEDAESQHTEGEHEAADAPTAREEPAAERTATASCPSCGNEVDVAEARRG